MACKVLHPEGSPLAWCRMCLLTTALDATTAKLDRANTLLAELGPKWAHLLNAEIEERHAAESRLAAALALIEVIERAARHGKLPNFVLAALATYTSATTPVRRERLPACIKAWPECEEGAYDPRCCRFPKSCSCEIWPATSATTEGES